jgi:hypothetical protein
VFFDPARPTSVHDVSKWKLSVFDALELVGSGGRLVQQERSGSIGSGIGTRPSHRLATQSLVIAFATMEKASILPGLSLGVAGEVSPGAFFGGP